MIWQRELFARERVDSRRHALRLRAIVDEHDRRSRAAHMAKHERGDGGPDRSTRHVPEILDR